MTSREAQGILCGEASHLLRSSENVMSQRMPFKQEVLELIVDKFCRGVVVTLYLIANHLHFLVYLVLRIGAVEHDVGEQVNGFRQMLAQHGSIEDGVFLVGEGVDVSAHAFQFVQYPHSVAPLRSLERHVLAEVRQSFLSCLLVARSCCYLKAAVNHIRI